MARQRTIGCEIDPNVSAGIDYSGSTFGTVTRDTTTFRSGASSSKHDSTGLNSSAYGEVALTVALGTGAYYRGYLRFGALPASTVKVLGVGAANAATVVSARLTSAGKLQLWNDTGTPAQIGSDSAATIATGIWYRIELFLKLATGAADQAILRLDGVQVADSGVISISDTAVAVADFGWVEAPGASKVCNVDDIAINDDAGSNQNSWPGDGKIVLLKPISDNQVGSWTGGAGGTTNLWDAVNNIPPVGLSAETNTSQIKRLAQDTTSTEYRANMTTYTTAGIVAADTITVVQPFENDGEEVATGTKNIKFQLLSNPAGAAANAAIAGDDVGALGTYPTNWRTHFATDAGTTVYNPSVTLGTSPVFLMNKTDAGTREADVDFMGIYVEYVPGAGGLPPGVQTFETPRGYPFPIEDRTWLQSTDLGLMGKDTQFAGPGQWKSYDYPNPRGYAYPSDLRTHLQPGLRIVVVQNPLLPIDWPNPWGYAYPLDLRTWLNAPSPGSLLVPFAQDDWPNPWGYPFSVEHRTWLQNLKQQLAGQDVQFRGPGQWTTYDYPNPRGYPYPSDLRTHLEPGLQVVVVLSPVIPSDWPNPRGYIFPVELRGWLYVPSPGALLAPFFQTDWPNPLGKAFPSDLRTYIFTLPPGVLLPPFAQFDWPVPKGAPFPSDLRTFVNGVEIQLIGQDVIYGAPGQVPTYNIENPRGAPNQVAWLYDVHGVFVGWFPAPPAGSPPLIYLLHSGKWAKKITDRIYIEIG